MPDFLPDDIEEKLSGLKAVGSQWVALCPSHDDRNPSLTLRMVEDKLLVHCHAGCAPRTVLDALGYQPPKREDGFVATYDYRDETGQLLFQVCRTVDKRFLQRRPDPTSDTGWRWKLDNTRRVLYRLPELLEAIAAGKSVCIAEGEKDVHALVSIGRVATCNPGGAGKWRAEYAEVFRDARVTIFADRDEPGQEHARGIAASLTGIAASWQIVEAADPHKDIAAHLGAGLAPQAVNITSRSDGPIQPDLGPDLTEFLATQDADHDWVVPGLLERGERLMLTGEEGGGKSTFNRQFAVLCAFGVHPVKLTRINPIRVLFIDCENSERLTRRKLRPMAAAAGRIGNYPDGGMRLIHKPAGLELEGDKDGAWLLERVTAYQPDLLVIGPLYKLHYANPKDEEVARKITGIIDAARVSVNCAVLIEAHSPNGEDSRHRSLRPLGSSLYRRWTDYGMGLRKPSGAHDDDYIQLQHWRGPRDERNWPALLHRADGGLAWEAADWDQYAEHTQKGPLHVVD